VELGKVLAVAQVLGLDVQLGRDTAARSPAVDLDALIDRHTGQP
jgi:hypothetical protein